MQQQIWGNIVVLIQTSSASSFPNLAVKKLWKMVYIWQSDHKNKSGLLFLRHSVHVTD